MIIRQEGGRWASRRTRVRSCRERCLTADEVSALIRACGRGPSGVRNAAMIAAMFGAALRVSETLALRPSDLDLELGMVRVRHGKGDRARTVAIDPSAQAYVERWIAKRDALGLERTAAALLHDHPERPVRGRPRLLLRPSATPTAGRPGRHRASSPPARASPFAGHCVGPRGEDVAGDQRPARALVDGGDRPVPAQDRPYRARRRRPGSRTAGVEPSGAGSEAGSDIPASVLVDDGLEGGV